MREDVKNFLNHWPVIKETFQGKDILLFLDYDGTLTPIVERPELAVLPEKIKKVFEKMISDERFKIFVVSGRALANVKKLVDIDDIVYLGNHGFEIEIEGAEIDFGNFSIVRFREILEYLKCEINKELIIFKDVFVEDKSLGLSVHYRLLNSKDESVLKIFLETITKEFISKNEIRIVAGKKVFEIRPPIAWNKGTAVQWVLRKYEAALKDQKAVVIYIGDDQTDEDAFQALNKIAITIHVGNSQSTAAEYYLESPQEVAEFLEYLVDLKGEKG